MEPPITSTSTIQASREQISRDLDGEAILLNLQTGTYYGLDAVGTRVWNLIQEPIMVGQVCDRLVEEYDVEPERCERDLLALFTQLAQRSLIEVRETSA